MEKVDTCIMNINNVICANIKLFNKSNRGFLSQNILSQLRNLVEHTALKAFSNGQDMEVTYANIEDANKFVRTRGELNFLYKFNKLRQITTSHYTLDPENSERLMLKYYEYLLRIKSYLHTMHGLDVLENINDFPLYTDTTLKEYYEKIAEQLQQPPYLRTSVTYNERYYILKTRPFFVKGKIYYEVTYTLASDKTSKFDRLIAFTKCEILSNYAVKLLMSTCSISILGKKMPIQIIDEWEVSIRPCELNNFADIFGPHPKLGGANEISELMKFLSITGINLVEFIDSPIEYYQSVKDHIARTAKSLHFLQMLDLCRKLSELKQPGYNVIRYLLYSLNNKIIKQQFNTECCNLLSGLHLQYGCFHLIRYHLTPL